MESTSVYWIPIFELLDARGFTVFLVNARDAKHVPVLGAEVVRSPVLDRARRTGLLAASLLAGVDAGLRDLFRSQRIDVVFESAQFFGWRLGLPVLAWIPDFQHRHLRHMFTTKGYWKRELGFQAEIAAGRTIMLSSEDARRDCERFYPRTVGRARAVRFAVPPGNPPTLAEARAVADSYGLPEHFLFMPNQLSKHKNHLLVLDALTLLRERGGSVVVVSSGKQLDERHPAHFPTVQAKLDALVHGHFSRYAAWGWIATLAVIARSGRDVPSR